MAKETVQAVRQAEMNAAEMEKEAIKKKEVIIADTHLEANNLVNNIVRQATEKAEQKLALAEEKGKELFEAARQKAEKEVALLKEIAGNKEEAAISIILSNII